MNQQLSCEMARMVLDVLRILSAYMPTVFFVAEMLCYELIDGDQ